MALAKLNMNSF